MPIKQNTSRVLPFVQPGFIILFIVFSICTSPAWAGAGPKLPSDAETCIRIPSVRTLFNRLLVTPNSILGHPIEGLDQIQKKFGFNPFSIKELEKIGLHPDAPWGYLFQGFTWKNPPDDPEYAYVVFLPAHSPEKLNKNIDNLIKRNYPEIQHKTEEGITTYRIPLTVGPKGKESSLRRIHLITLNNYVFIEFDNIENKPPYLKTIRNIRTPLENTPEYQHAIQGIPRDSDIFLYIHIKPIMDRNYPLISKAMDSEKKTTPNLKMGNTLETLKDCRTFSASFDASTKDFISYSKVALIPGTTTHSLFQNTRPATNSLVHLVEIPVCLLSFTFNIEDLYKQFFSSLTKTEAENMKMQFKTIQSSTGIDIEKEIIENLEGNVSMGIYDGLSINLLNYNALITLNLKDGEKMRQVIRKAANTLPQEKKHLLTQTSVSGVDTYVMMAGVFQVYFGIIDNVLVIAQGKPVYQNAVQAKQGRGNGFMGQNTPQEIKNTILKNPNYMYINFQELKKVFTNFSQFFKGKTNEAQKAISAFDKLSYLISSSRLNNNDVVSELYIRTLFEQPFFSGIVKQAKGEKNKP